MILLFGEKAKAHSSTKNTGVKNNPVENSGILANKSNNSLLAMNEYDIYMFSQQAEINYEIYSNENYFNGSDIGFMSSFENAISILGDCSSEYSCDASFSSGCDCSCSCSSFSSVC